MSEFEAVSDQAARYGDLDARLRLEIPFFARLLRENGARNVCDAGCGEGRHTIALARGGEFALTGLEPRAEAVEAARRNAALAGASVDFFAGFFSDMPALPGAPFDAALALGACLSLVEDWPVLEKSAADIAGALRPGGVFVGQIPNYGAMLADPAKRWKGLSVNDPPPGKPGPLLCMKHFAPWGERYFAVEFLSIQPDGKGGWISDVRHARQLALTRARIEGLLAPWFAVERAFGHADGRDFDPSESPDLIFVARRK